MKQFDPISAAQPTDSDNRGSYFSHGLVSKIITNDQHLAQPTEQVLRRRWITRMILAEFAFVLGVLLLQWFPAVEASTSAAIASPTVTSTATPTIIPTPTVTDVATSATAAPAQVASSTQPTMIVPLALPNTGTERSSTLARLAGPLFAIAVGGVLRLIGVLQPRLVLVPTSSYADRHTARQEADR